MTLTVGARVLTPLGEIRTVVDPIYHKSPTVRVVPHRSNLLVLLDDQTAWEPGALVAIPMEAVA